MRPSLNVARLIFVCALVKVIKTEVNTTSSHPQRTLSRKKRFLIFPEGSSLQLVYCLTIPSIGMGSIFTIGWTAALAWELPHEPIHPYSKKNKEALQRMDRPGSSTYGGWTVSKNKGASTSAGDNKRKEETNYYNFLSDSSYSTIRDYLRRPGYSSSKMGYNVSPAMNYRDHFKGKHEDYSAMQSSMSGTRPSFKSNNNAAREEAPIYYHPVYKEVHRKTRRDLFGKIQKFLDAQKLDGKACLLKAICEVSKTSSNEAGTFMEEIIKAIFRIKPYKSKGEGDEFDVAADDGHNCTERYARCSTSVWSLL